MPFELDLGQPLKGQRWKVKIFDNEKPVETPHVTIYRGNQHKRRFDLRRGEGFLDEGDSWNGVPAQLRAAVEQNLELLRERWDAMHGDHNPISSREDDA